MRNRVAPYIFNTGRRGECQYPGGKIVVVREPVVKSESDKKEKRLMSLREVFYRRGIKCEMNAGIVIGGCD